MTLNPLTKLLIPVLEVANDRLVNTDGQERLEYWKAFQALWEIFPGKNVTYGELYNRYMIGNILFVMTRAMEREKGHETVPLEHSDISDAPLGEWTESDWGMFAESLRTIADNLVRMDAGARIGDERNEAVDPARVEALKTTDSRFLKILKYIKVYKLTAGIRPAIIGQVEDKSIPDDDYPRSINNKMLRKMWLECHEEENQPVRDYVISKLFNVKDDRSSGEVPPLRSMGEIRRAMNDKPLSLFRFDERVDVLMVDWIAIFFDEPHMTRFYFPDEDVSSEQASYAPSLPQGAMPNSAKPSQSRGGLRALRNARRLLRETGEDPLNESRRLAEQATGAGSSGNTRASSANRRRSSQEPKEGRLYSKKRSATSIQFDDGDEQLDDADPNADGRPPVLGPLPSQSRRRSISGISDKENSPNKKTKKSQQKKYQGKRPWSDEEKRAIIEGLRSCGKGKWAQIKDEYDVVFEMRTSGQIKDCFRRMLTKGEIPPDLIDHQEEEEEEERAVHQDRTEGNNEIAHAVV